MAKGQGAKLNMKNDTSKKTNRQKHGLPIVIVTKKMKID